MKRGPGSPGPVRRRRLGPACLHRDDFDRPGPAADRPYAGSLALHLRRRPRRLWGIPPRRRTLAPWRIMRA
eukprot:3606438-Pyramimonas_sp.AAC.1